MRILQITNKDKRLDEYYADLVRIAKIAEDNNLFGRVSDDGVILNPFIHFQGLPPKLETFLQILAQKCMVENYQLVQFRVNEDEATWKTKIKNTIEEDETSK